MTKRQLLKELEGLDDDANITVETPDNEYYLYNIGYTKDKVTGADVQNEATLVCR